MKRFFLLQEEKGRRPRGGKNSIICVRRPRREGNVGPISALKKKKGVFREGYFPANPRSIPSDWTESRPYRKKTKQGVRPKIDRGGDTAGKNEPTSRVDESPFEILAEKKTRSMERRGGKDNLLTQSSARRKGISRSFMAGKPQLGGEREAKKERWIGTKSGGGKRQTLKGEKKKGGASPRPLISKRWSSEKFRRAGKKD